jgi:hypothetical protein
MPPVENPDSLSEEAAALTAEQREFRSEDRAALIAAVLLALLCIAVAVVMPLLPYSGTPAPLGYKVGMSAFFGCGALLMVYLALQHTTRVLRLTDTALIDRSVFGTREIPFDQVVSATTREMTGKSGVFEVTTVRSAAAAISFSSRMPNYDRLVQSIHARVGVQVAGNMSQALSAESRRSLQVNVIGLFIMGCLFGVGLGYVGAMSLHQGQDALKRQVDLDIHGQRTTGETLGVGKVNTKSPRYYLNYSFQVDGKTYAHASTVSSDVYDHQPIGSAVQVDYLPDQPDVSRVTLSIARQTAESTILFGKGMMVFACVLPILLSGLAYAQRPRFRGTGGRTASS